MIKIAIITLIALSAIKGNAQQKCIDRPAPQFSILIDLSEPLSAPSTIAFNTLSKRIVDVLPSSGKLNVYTIKLNAEDVAKKPDYEICIPDFNAMKGDKFRERAKLKFEQQVLPNLEKLGGAYVNARKSPIVENIFKISHSTFLKSLDQPHTLVVISDFVQYSDLADFYTNVPGFGAFSSNHKADAWMPKINNVKMHMVMLSSDSSGKVDVRKVRSFWLDYAKSNFKQCGFSGINDASVSFKNDC